MDKKKKPASTSTKGPSPVGDLARFPEYWRVWKKGEKLEQFDSRESIGVGHYKLWKFLTTERRYWRRYLDGRFGFCVRTGKFNASKRRGGDPRVPILDGPPLHAEGRTATDVLDLWSRRRECLRHPFYQALEQYLAVCECLERCGDPPDLLAVPNFARHWERQSFLTIRGKQYSKSLLLREMEPSDAIPGETYGEYMGRQPKRFRCRDVSGAFDAVYLPLIKILAPEAGPVGDTAEFYGALADSFISLSKDKRLRKVLADDGADPYEQKRLLIPRVVENLVLRQLWNMPDLLKREAAFRKLPGKTAYALGKALGVTKRQRQPLTVPVDEDSIESTRRSLEERIARDQISEQYNRGAEVIDAQLSTMQRKVFWMNRREGFTIEQIAKILDIKPGTVASHLARARSKIAAHLQQKKE